MITLLSHQTLPYHGTNITLEVNHLLSIKENKMVHQNLPIGALGSTWFKHLSFYTWISVAKIIHNLINANTQNHEYYKTTPLCPYCLNSTKTLDHAFSCINTASWISIERPLTRPVQDTAVSTNYWHYSTQHQEVGAMTNRSWFPNLCTICRLPKRPWHPINNGCYKKNHSLGWIHFLYGRLSKTWSKVVSAMASNPYSLDQQISWAAQTILCLWKYTRSLCMGPPQPWENWPRGSS